MTGIFIIFASWAAVVALYLLSQAESKKLDHHESSWLFIGFVICGALAIIITGVTAIVYLSMWVSN